MNRGGVALLGVALAAGPARADEPLPATPDPRCARAVELATVAVHDEAWLDGHLIAQVGRLDCVDVELDVLDAIALARLDEGTRARAVLAPWQVGATAARVGTLAAWTHWLERDDAAFAASVARLPLAEHARLAAFADPSPTTIARALDHQPAQRDAALAALAGRAAARERRPWLAGLLSAIVPGAGQAYAGSLESAAMAFVLNGLAIGATVELARRDMWWTAALAGTVGSMFYVGNIGSAVDLARRRNELAQLPWDTDLRRALLPEAYP